MHRERPNFESRSVSFPSSPRSTGSFKRNSVRALKDTCRRPGGLEMILASVDDSLVLLSDLIATTGVDDANVQSDEHGQKLTIFDPTGNDENEKTCETGEKVKNYASLVRKSRPPSNSGATARIDLTEKEIVQWMGGLPTVDREKIFGYFCTGSNQEKRNIFAGRRPYRIFSLAPKRRTSDQIATRNLICEVRELHIPTFHAISQNHERFDFYN